MLKKHSSFLTPYPQIDHGPRPFTDTLHAGHVWDGCMSLSFKDLEETVKANHFPGIKELGNKKRLFTVSFSSLGFGCNMISSSLELLSHAGKARGRWVALHGGHLHVTGRDGSAEGGDGEESEQVLDHQTSGQCMWAGYSDHQRRQKCATDKDTFVCAEIHHAATADRWTEGLIPVAKLTLTKFLIQV